jgi:hypothetical protein
MEDKEIDIKFKVLNSGSIIHKLTSHTSVIFDKEGTFSLTPYKPKKSDIIGEIKVTVPESIYKNVYALSLHRTAKERINEALKKAKKMVK